MFFERWLHGRIARTHFQRELHLVYIKIWDVQEGQYFWYNLQSKESTWDKPKMLIR